MGKKPIIIPKFVKEVQEADWWGVRDMNGRFSIVSFFVS